MKPSNPSRRAKTVRFTLIILLIFLTSVSCLKNVDMGDLARKAVKTKAKMVNTLNNVVHGSDGQRKLAADEDLEELYEAYDPNSSFSNKNIKVPSHKIYSKFIDLETKVDRSFQLDTRPYHLALVGFDIDQANYQISKRITLAADVKHATDTMLMATLNAAKSFVSTQPAPTVYTVLLSAEDLLYYQHLKHFFAANPAIDAVVTGKIEYWSMHDIRVSVKCTDRDFNTLLERSYQEQFANPFTKDQEKVIKRAIRADLQPIKLNLFNNQPPEINQEKLAKNKATLQQSEQILSGDKLAEAIQSICRQVTHDLWSITEGKAPIAKGKQASVEIHSAHVSKGTAHFKYYLKTELRLMQNST